MRLPYEPDGIGHAMRVAADIRRYTTRTRQDWRDILGGTPISPPGMVVGMVRGPLLVAELPQDNERLLFACPLPGGDGRRYWLELTACRRFADAWDYAGGGAPRHMGRLDRIGIEKL